MIDLSLGFSPCPNDTYIFDALVHKKIPHNYNFEVQLEDVETLNQMALAEELDITKVSIFGSFFLRGKYRMLSSGGALGRGCGPLVIGKKADLFQGGKIALPGKLTTASLLFQLAVPGNFELVFMPFDKIIPAITEGDVDFGVIIHESRFTYQEAGLELKFDLGAWWEKESGCPLPLGGISVSNRLDKKTALEIEHLIKNSVINSEKNPESPQKFIKENSQELAQDVINQHIELYVNEYSKDLGLEGKAAIKKLFHMSGKAGLLPGYLPEQAEDLFI